MSAASNEPTTQRGALHGVRVVEFAQNVAVPSCGRALAAMGAEVIKVEPPMGDAARSMGPFGHLSHEGRTYALANLGKRSVVLDLTDERAAAPRDALLASADVVLCAFKGSDLRRYGLEYERVRALNPTVVYLDHRAFGSKGPDAEEGGYDVLVQGVSGLSFVSSRSERGRPISVRPAYSDMTTGMTSTAAVLAALYHRAMTGEGQRVETSLLATAHWLAMPTNGRFDDHETEARAELAETLALMHAGGASFDEKRSVFEDIVMPVGGSFDFCFRHYATQDSMISVGCLSNPLMDKFYAVTGIPDPRGRKIEYRGEEWWSLVDRAEEIMRSDTTDGWLTRLRAAKVPCARYLLPTEAIDDEGALANGFVEDVDHPTIGRYRTTATPIAMDRTPVRSTGPSPALGAHTDEVLRALGFDGDQLAALHDAGITRPR